MKNWQSLISTIVLFSLSACSLASQSEQNINAVAYCELVENPSQYDGQEVRVRATYITGFEWAFLSDEKCPNDNNNSTLTWLIIPQDAKLCEDATWVNQTSPPQISRNQSLARDLTFTGIFHNSRGGHLGGYPFVMEFVCLKDIGKWQVIE